MEEQNGRFNWLRDDMKTLREEQREGFESLHRRLDDLNTRTTKLEQEAYARISFWQRMAFVGAPLIGAFCGWLVSWLPRRG